MGPQSHSQQLQNQDSSLALPPQSPGALAAGGPLRVTAWFPLGLGLAPIRDSETLLNGQVEAGSTQSDDSDIIAFLHLSIQPV